MIIFTEPAATYYCQNVQPITPTHPSIRDFLQSNTGIFTLSEGTQIFEEYQKLSLENVELSIFYALSHYRRMLDGILVSGIPWSHITAYYGSFFAASAILGMFGCTIGMNYVVQVDQHTPGRQRLSSKRIGNRTGQEYTITSGPHRRFWDIFYNSVPPLIINLPPNLSALSPVSNNNIWLIETRNDINYDTKKAFNLSRTYLQSSSASSSFPSNLTGKFATQYRIFEGLLEIMFHYAKRFKIKTSVLSIFGNKSLPTILRQEIYKSTPNLISKTKKNSFLKW